MFHGKKSLYHAQSKIAYLTVLLAFSCSSTYAECEKAPNTQAAIKCLEAKITQTSQQKQTSTSNYTGIPRGAVVPFNISSCPEGWEIYTNAAGRFIRGIDPSGKNDPDGQRQPGSLQDDALKIHQHKITVTYNGTDAPRAPYDAWALTRNKTRAAPEYEKMEAEGTQPETRPKNVALLFCQKR